MRYNEIIASYPLTDIQKGMLYEIASNNYSTPIYIVQNIFEIKDNFNLPFFIQAFNAVLNRHEILRSAIIQNSTSYAQVVYGEAKIPYEFYDYTTLFFDEKESSFSVYLASDVNRGLEISKPPLMRLAFFKFGDANYRFVWTRHHILIDGVSAEMLIDELFTIYHALLEGEEWLLPKPIQYSQIYRDNQQTDIEVTKDYWLNALKGYSNAALLPVLPNRSSNIKKIKHKHEMIEGNSYSQLIKFVNKYSLTMNTVLQGALGLVLSHYSDKDNVMLGIVRAYPKEKTSNCIGLFINTLPICLEANPSIKTIDYLRDIRQKNLLLREHVDIPLSKIKEWCSLSIEAPLYQCVMDYKPRSLNAVLKKHFSAPVCNASIRLDIPYPFVFEIVNEGDALQIKLHFDAALLEDYYATSFLKHFKNVLTLMSQDVDCLSEFTTLRKDELTKIFDWNKTQIAYPVHKTAHQLFEEQVQKTPSAIAICFGNQSLTYQMLNLQANQLANYLIEQGVVVETRVAIFLRPALNMIVAILGVLKAGGIYIPLDVQYPVERICYLLKNSQPTVIITQSEQNDLLNQITSKNNAFCPIVINLDEPEWKYRTDANPKLPIQSSCGMYIIYTSGSTGSPKGVLIEHRSAVNTALSCIERLQVTPQSRVLQISSFSFDVSVAEWCMTLLSGASLYLINKDIFTPEAILNSLKTYKITTIILASSILAVLPTEHLPDLKVIAPGGEPCALSVVKFWARDRLFINVYGVTEAAICSTMSNYSSEYSRTSDIGMPLPNTQIYILDRYLRPVPVGVTGEIYIGGIGIARGYINNNELTREKFVFYTLSLNNKNIRLYKTGDYGRWLPTGNIECLGRKDEQIKIRGFRVELSEIEHILEKHPIIKQAAIVVKETPIGKQLLAYILPVKQLVDIKEIRKFIQAQLPSFMIPANFHQLQELPLTPNGKIDKKKLLLLAPDDKFDNQSHNFSVLSELEETIKQVVQTLLQSNQVSIDTNFLDLGFNSLGLVQFAEHLSQVLGRKVSILDLFTCTTIKTLSAYIDDKNSNEIIIKNRGKQAASVKSNRIVFADEY